MTEPVYTQDWCSFYFKSWARLIPRASSTIHRVLEVGSFEGRSTCFWANYYQPDTIFCVDTWGGSVEHTDFDFEAIERNFNHNTQDIPGIVKCKGTSTDCLSRLIADRVEQFDLIYVDGDHHPQTVLSDICLAFTLLGVGGYLIMDDYLWVNRMRFGPWHGELPGLIYKHPKPAIDAFCNIFEDRIRILDCSYQMVLQKLS